eukprot:632704-Pyramimonas_sp.AAC.1
MALHGFAKIQDCRLVWSSFLDTTFDHYAATFGVRLIRYPEQLGALLEAPVSNNIRIDRALDRLIDDH